MPTAGYIADLLLRLQSNTTVPTEKISPGFGLWVATRARVDIQRISGQKHLPEIARLIKTTESPHTLIELSSCLISILRYELRSPNTNTVEKAQKLMIRLLKKSNYDETVKLIVTQHAYDTKTIIFLYDILSLTRLIKINWESPGFDCDA